MPTQQSNNFSLFEKEREKANPMVATLANHLVNIRKKNIAASLSDFEGSSHKLARVKTINTIDFIDDSRSTNANAVWYALQSMTKPTVWICGIDQVEKITQDLIDQVLSHVKAIVLQGVYNSDVYNFLSSLDIPVFVEMNLEDAVRQAFYACDRNYAVLFSPGVNGTAQMTYRQRGDLFQEAVGQL